MSFNQKIYDVLGFLFRENKRSRKTSRAGWEGRQGDSEDGGLRGLWWRGQEWPGERDGGSQEEAKEKDCDWLKFMPGLQKKDLIG